MTDDRQISLNRVFVHSTLAGIVICLISVGAYMLQWNRDYFQNSALIAERMENIVVRLSKIEETLDRGILREADWRLKNLEGRVDELEEEHDDFNFNSNSQ